MPTGCRSLCVTSGFSHLKHASEVTLLSAATQQTNLNDSGAIRRVGTRLGKIAFLILKNKMQREDSLPVFSADEDKSIDHEGKYYVIVLAINGLRYVHIRVHIK